MATWGSERRCFCFCCRRWPSVPLPLVVVLLPLLVVLLPMTRSCPEEAYPSCGDCVPSLIESKLSGDKEEPPSPIAGTGVASSPDSASTGAMTVGTGAPVKGIDSWPVIGAAVAPAGAGVALSGKGAAVPTEPGAWVISGAEVAPSGKGAAVPTEAGAWLGMGEDVAPSGKGTAVPTVLGTGVEAGKAVASAASDGDGVATMDSTGSPSMPTQSSFSP